jgi:hypothetical protein
MKYKGVNHITVPFDDHFYTVLEVIADYVGKSSQGKVAADVETTIQLLVIRGIHDLIRQQNKVNPEFARKLQSLIEGN